MLRERGIDLDAMKEEQAMQDVDDFDFICHVAFDAKPLTRKEAAEVLRRGRDEEGHFFSIFTWAALTWFVSGLWEHDA